MRKRPRRGRCDNRSQCLCLPQDKQGMEIKMKDGLQHPVAVMGLPINSLKADDVVETLERLILSGGTHQICTVNVDIWLNALADPHLHRIMAGSTLLLPDGMPLVWAAGLLGCPLVERVTGVDLVPRLAELSARKGYGIFLLGAKPGVAERAGKLLKDTYPGVRIVGTYAPVEENLIRMDHNEILSQIHAVKPDILLVAFGNPKQEKWIWMHRKRLGVPLAMGVGGSFDILAGDVRRAPRWIQECGLEWAMRLLQEPVRLSPRYLRDFLGLWRRLPLALFAAWCQRPFMGHSRVTTATTPKVMHVDIHGKLGSECASAVQAATTASIVNWPGDGSAFAPGSPGDGGGFRCSAGRAASNVGSGTFALAGRPELENAFCAVCLAAATALRRVAAGNFARPSAGPRSRTARPYGHTNRTGRVSGADAHSRLEPQYLARWHVCQRQSAARAGAETARRRPQGLSEMP